MGYNLPDNVSASDLNAPWNKDEIGEGYYFQIELPMLIEEAGGRDAIIGHDEPYHYLVEIQDKLVKKYLRYYDEVGEVHTETIQDYVDAIIEEETPT